MLQGTHSPLPCPPPATSDPCNRLTSHHRKCVAEVVFLAIVCGHARLCGGRLATLGLRGGWDGLPRARPAGSYRGCCHHRSSACLLVSFVSCPSSSPLCLSTVPLLPSIIRRTVFCGNLPCVSWYLLVIPSISRPSCFSERLPGPNPAWPRSERVHRLFQVSSRSGGRENKLPLRPDVPDKC